MQLTQQILDFIQTGKGNFNQLALAVFAYQFEHCEPYQHYCRQLNVTPDLCKTWKEVPAVSTEVFREFDLCTLPIETARYVFHTSGTTQETKGKHYYHDMSLYDAAIKASFMQGLGLSNQDQVCFRILTPSFCDISSSSLFYMFQKILEWNGVAGSHFYFKNNELDCALLVQDLQADIAANRPVILLGTAFSYVNFFDYLDQQKISLKLPRESRLLETGGLKGRARTVSRAELYQLFTEKFSLASNHCFSEYGMTELSSQSYSQPNSHIFSSPAWMPVKIIDPETSHEVGVGETGLVQFFDLANVTAVSAIVTSDLAVKHEQGFELIGRASKAVLRGCSTAFET